jgi:hypothetical protein
MFAPEFKFAPVARRLAAATLVLWLAGAGCFFGCEMVTASAAARQAESTAHSRHASSGHDCCHKAKSNRPQSVSLQNARGGADIRQVRSPAAEQGCCPLSRQSSPPARRVSLKVAPLVEPVGRPAGTPHAPAAAPPATPALLRVPDRGSTRLRGCVFLI